MSHRCALVSASPSPRFQRKEVAEVYADKEGLDVCYLRWCANNLECSFGWGIRDGDKILGLDEKDYRWI